MYGKKSLKFGGVDNFVSGKDIPEVFSFDRRLRFKSFTIDKDGKIIGFELWHKVEGKWVHIIQQINDNKLEGYTNGVKIKL